MALGTEETPYKRRVEQIDIEKRKGVYGGMTKTYREMVETDRERVEIDREGAW